MYVWVSHAEINSTACQWPTVLRLLTASILHRVSPTCTENRRVSTCMNNRVLFNRGIIRIKSHRIASMLSLRNIQRCVLVNGGGHVAKRQQTHQDASKRTHDISRIESWKHGVLWCFTRCEREMCVLIMKDIKTHHHKTEQQNNTSFICICPEVDKRCEKKLCVCLCLQRQ